MGESLIVRRGGGSARINIANYAILPASGRDNQIALINNTAINDVYLQSEIPTTPTQGDVWIVVSVTGTAYLQFDSMKISIASIRQYDNGVWTYVSPWYVWQSGSWITGRLTLIEDGAFTGEAGITFTSKMWAKNGFTTVGTATMTEEADCIQLDFYNTSSTAGSNGYAGICSSEFDVGQYSNIHFEGRFQWKFSGTDVNQRADLMVNNIGATNPDIDALVYYTFMSAPTASETWYPFNVDIPVASSTSNYLIYIGIIGRYSNRHHYIQVFDLYLD